MVTRRLAKYLKIMSVKNSKSRRRPSFKTNPNLHLYMYIVDNRQKILERFLRLSGPEVCSKSITSHRSCFAACIGRIPEIQALSDRYRERDRDRATETERQRQSDRDRDVDRTIERLV